MNKTITTNNGVMNETQTTNERPNERPNEKKIWKGRKPNPEYLPMKKCKTCGEVKTIDDFYTNKMMHDGHLAQCKSCQSNQMKEHHKTPEGKEVLSRAGKKYFQSPKGKFTSVKSGHRIRGGGKITMTQDEFIDLMESQTECAICGVVFDRNNKPFTDHILAVKNKEGVPSPLSVENIQLLCEKCSDYKSNKTLTKLDILSIKMRRQFEKEGLSNE